MSQPFNQEPSVRKPIDEYHDGLTFEIVEEEQNPEGQKIKSRGIYLWPNLITTAALLSGFYSIIASSNNEFSHAIFAIFLASLLDGLDGRVARWTGAQSAFGEQYDSLSDMLSFGVAPAMLMYSWALEPLGRIGLACAFIFTACAALRLARFNVQIGSVDKRYFIGLASPLAAILAISAVWVGIDNADLFNIADRTWQIIYAAIIVISGLLMVSNVKYFSFKQLDRKRVPFAVMLPVILVLAAVTYNIPIGILVVAIIYALSGIVTTLMAKRSSV